tara:strand:- start:48 stop:254 length:207 start_codon:yes stop_codon:yes gene_type:complete
MGFALAIFIFYVLTKSIDLFFFGDELFYLFDPSFAQRQINKLFSIVILIGATVGAMISWKKHKSKKLN